MSGPLEGSVTLEDVFSVVTSKRVPLAPELAGYLALEIAEGADTAAGDVDPRCVYVAEEGTVALVHPRREGGIGSAEASIRAILGRLLEASGAQTPALSLASRRRSTGNLRALAEELEAALIPVNRAAGRRALARLAREVKRVTLGVGRNASVPPSRGPSPSQSSRAPSNPSFRVEEAPTARRDVTTEAAALGAPPAQQAAAEKPIVHTATPGLSPRPIAKSGSDVDSLLATFEVSHQRTDPAVARDLKAMAGLDLTPPPPTPPPPKAGGLGVMRTDSGVEALLALSESSPRGTVRAGPPPPSPLGAPQPPGAPPPPIAPERASYPSVPRTIAGLGPEERAAAVAAPAPRSALGSFPKIEPRPLQISTGSDFMRVKRRGADRFLVVLLLGLLVLAAAAISMLKLPVGFFTGRTPEKVAQEKAAAEAAHAQAIAAQQAAACHATLVVADVPENAEVLLREGQAPVDVERMPVGARLEFVATAEGYAAKRTVVPAGAAWDHGADGKPRFEVAVQLDKLTRPKGDLWPPGEPGSEVGG